MKRPVLALLGAAMALVVAAPPADATISVSIQNGVVKWTDNNMSVGALPGGAPVTIDPKGAGPDDDQVVFGEHPDSFSGGCTATTSEARCPLKSGQNLITRIEMNTGGSFADQWWRIDIDRPGVPMELVYTSTGGSQRVDASATDAGKVTINGAAGNITPQGFKGGGGDDTLIGNTAGNLLDGGPGDDTITGGKGDDTMTGGPGDDAILPGEGAANVVDGGEGTRDSIGFADLPAGVGVTVSLDGVDNDSAGANGFHITGIEDVTGTESGDTITGDAGFNHLYGLGGPDNIAGGGGGHDVLRGNTGDDTLGARDTPELFSDVGCGAGTDTAVVDALDVVASDCESVDRSAASGGGGGGGGGGGNGEPSGGDPGGGSGLDGDTVAPTIRLTKKLAGTLKRKKFRRGLTLKLGLSEPARLEAELVATAPGGHLKDNLVLARKTRAKASGALTLKLVPDRGLLGRLKRVTVRVRAIDGEGNVGTLTRSVKLKR